MVFAYRQSRPGASWALQRAPADVVPAEPIRPADTGNGLVSAVARLRHILAEGGDVEHASAVGEEAISFGLGTGMKDFDAFDSRRLVQPFDDRTFGIGSGIAACGHHDSQRGFRIPAQID